MRVTTIAECVFWVPGAAVAQPRQRFRAVWLGAVVAARAYRDDKHPIHGFKIDVQKAWLEARPASWPLGKKVAYELLVYVVRSAPKALPKRRAGRFRCNTKPDCDNVTKGIKDALNGLAWDDDGRVYDERTVKVWAAPGEAEGTRVVIRALPFGAVSTD